MITFVEIVFQSSCTDILMALQSISRHFSTDVPTDFLVFYLLLRYRSKCVDLKNILTVEFLNRHILIDISMTNRKLENRLHITSRNVLILILVSSEYQYNHNWKCENWTTSVFFRFCTFWGLETMISNDPCYDPLWPVSWRFYDPVKPVMTRKTC